MSMVWSLFILIVLLFLAFSYLVRRNIDGPHNEAVMDNPCACPSCPCHYMDAFIEHLRPAENLYAYIVLVISNVMTSMLVAVTDVAENMSSAVNCAQSPCHLPRQSQVINRPFYIPDLVTGEYSDKDVKRIKSIEDRKPEKRDAHTDAMPRRADTDKISDYEVVFDRPPPPPFVRTPLSSTLPPPKKPSPPELNKPPPPSKGIQQPNQDKLPEIKIPGTSTAQPQTDVYPFENKPKDMFPKTSSLLAEAGSSKRKSIASDPSSEVEIKSCRKCLEKGRTCISDCPNAKDWEGRLSDMVPKVERLEMMPPDTNISVLFQPRRCIKCLKEKNCTSQDCPFRRRSSISLRRNSSTSTNLVDHDDSEGIDSHRKKLLSRRHSEHIGTPPKEDDVEFKECSRCLLCNGSCVPPNGPRISFSEGENIPRSHREQDNGDKTGRRRTSILRKELEIVKNKIQDEDKNENKEQKKLILEDGSKRKSNSEIDNFELDTENTGSAPKIQEHEG